MTLLFTFDTTNKKINKKSTIQMTKEITGKYQIRKELTMAKITYDRLNSNYTLMEESNFPNIIYI